MVLVVDKKVVKHLVETGDGLLEIPIRVKFEYRIEDQRFIDGSMTRDFLYNRQAVEKHFPGMDMSRLDNEISATVDQSLEEGLRYQGHVRGRVHLYPATEPPAEDSPRRKIILPGEK